jgi:hypothetical protein
MALNELFSSIRVRIGDFTFETYNDSPGGKDKARVSGARELQRVPSRQEVSVGRTMGKAARSIMIRVGGAVCVCLASAMRALSRVR